MTMRSWARNLFTRPATRPIRKAQHRARLALEALEDRTVPSGLPGAYVLDGGYGGGSSAGGIPYNGGPLLTHVEVQGVYYNDPATLGLQSQLDGF